MLLQAAGYQIRIYPAIGKTEVDTLIGLIDFLAIRPDRAMAGCVTERKDPKYLRTMAASPPDRSVGPPGPAFSEGASQDRNRAGYCGCRRLSFAARRRT